MPHMAMKITEESQFLHKSKSTRMFSTSREVQKLTAIPVPNSFLKSVLLNRISSNHIIGTYLDYLIIYLDWI